MELFPELVLVSRLRNRMPKILQLTVQKWFLLLATFFLDMRRIETYMEVTGWELITMIAWQGKIDEGY
jgi:hypothetical protein